MTTIELKNRYIASPGTLGGPFNHDDGIGLAGDYTLSVKNCVVDFSSLPIGDAYQDESAAITRGCEAAFERCIIKGAGKLFLMGCGDEDWKSAEWRKTVRLTNCILEDGGRRFPEVQDGMDCTLTRCLIQHWSDPDRFNVRGFGAWAHDDGRIFANGCVFIGTPKGAIPLSQRIRDRAAHIGQAVNDEGLKALFQRKTYVPGWERALFATDGGEVRAYQCWFGDGLYTDSNESPMCYEDALTAIKYFDELRKSIYSSLS